MSSAWMLNICLTLEAVWGAGEEEKHCAHTIYLTHSEQTLHSVLWLSEPWYQPREEGTDIVPIL